MLLLPELKEDPHAAELLQLARVDAALGRMSEPVPAAALDLEAVRLNPRFAVVQGFRDDGAEKVRAIDNLSWSAPDESLPKRRRTKKVMKSASVNGHVVMAEKIRHNHLDDLFRAMRLFIALVGTLPCIYKADIDAAFRCGGMR